MHECICMCHVHTQNGHSVIWHVFCGQILEFQKVNDGPSDLLTRDIFLATGIQMFDAQDQNKKLGIARATPR